MDPKSRRPLEESEKILFAQVFLHEIDEGVRLLWRTGKIEEANIVGNFNNDIHFSNRLEYLRQLIEEIHNSEFPPQRVQYSHKARNNQMGAVKMRLGRHPAVALTDTGIGYKDRNEDAFLLMPEEKVMALADGLGGHPGGNIASCMAIDFFEYGILQGMGMENAICFANDAILVRSKNDTNLGGMYPMGCTFAGVQLKHSLLKAAHVGDTKVLLIRDGKILSQTQDHTKGQQLLREGIVDLGTAFELNHILNRCLGLDRMQPQRDVSVTWWDLEPGDRVMILTDGISDNFFDTQFGLDQVAEIAGHGSLTQAAELLVEACQSRMTAQTLPNGHSPKPDNISLAMMEYRG